MEKGNNTGWTNRRLDLEAPSNNFTPNLNECYRLAATVYKSAFTGLQTLPISWGYGGTDGAVAHNRTNTIEPVKPISALRRNVCKHVSAGNRLSLFLGANGKVYQAGSLYHLQDRSAMWKPKEVTFNTKLEIDIVAVEAGNFACYALDTQGSLFSWGSNSFGQLGWGEKETHSKVVGIDSNNQFNKLDVAPPTTKNTSHENETIKDVPCAIPKFFKHPVRKVSAGNHFVLAITSSGNIYSWGRGCNGQLGHGQIVDFIPMPTLIKSLTQLIAIDVFAGHSHSIGIFQPRTDFTLGIVKNPAIFAWGKGAEGRLGLGDQNNRLFPAELLMFRGLHAVQVVAGHDHTLVLCSAGNQAFLYAFGGNKFGQLGIGSTIDFVEMPHAVEEFLDVSLVWIGAGAHYSCALSGDGQVFLWGDSRHGKTALEFNNRVTYIPWGPIKFCSKEYVSQLSVGSYHSLGLIRNSACMNRRRKFPCQPVVNILDPEVVLNMKATTMCVCSNSHTKTRGFYGILLKCVTCQTGPICRPCQIACHAYHISEPLVMGPGEHKCNCYRQINSALLLTNVDMSNIIFACKFARLENLFYASTLNWASNDDST